MPEHRIKIGSMAVLCAALGGALGVQTAWAQSATVPAEAPGEAVQIEAQLLKDADDLAFSAQQLQPIALDTVRAPIDPSTLQPADAPGTAVSGTARTLRDLDRADIPAMARTLGGIARGSLPGAAASPGSHSPSVPAVAQNRGQGRGRH